MKSKFRFLTKNYKTLSWKLYYRRVSHLLVSIFFENFSLRTNIWSKNKHVDGRRVNKLFLTFFLFGMMIFLSCISCFFVRFTVTVIFPSPSSHHELSWTFVFEIFCEIQIGVSFFSVFVFLKKNISPFFRKKTLP